MFLLNFRYFELNLFCFRLFSSFALAILLFNGSFSFHLSIFSLYCVNAFWYSAGFGDKSPLINFCAVVLWVILRSSKSLITSLTFSVWFCFVFGFLRLMFWCNFSHQCVNYVSDFV